MKIAVVEDSKKIGYIIYKAFERENIDIELFESIEETQKIKPDQYIAYIVDYNLKDGTGLEFIKRIRQRHETTPILMLTVRDALEDKLDVFNAGADDYLTKPFELAELIARIKALINRTSKTQLTNITIKGIDFDMKNMTISYKSIKIPFSKKEYQIIKYLLHNRGQIVEKDKIIDNVWIDSDEKDPNIVNVYMNRIRKKLQDTDAPDFIDTVRGFGYVIR